MVTEVIEAPLPGKVLTVNVKKGNAVREGDTICTIEAMKMENSILAPINGTLTELNVVNGQVVSVGAILAVIEATEGTK